MNPEQTQLHQALAIIASYEKALNEIINAKTIEEAQATAAKVLLG